MRKINPKHLSTSTVYNGVCKVKCGTAIFLNSQRINSINFLLSN